MEFVNADRSHDSNFLAGLQNYNNEIFEDNKAIKIGLKANEDTQKQQDELIKGDQSAAQTKTLLALSGVGTGLVEKKVRVGKVLEERAAKKAAREVAINRSEGVAAEVASEARAPAIAAAEVAVEGGADLAEVGGSVAAREALEEAGEGGGKVLAKGLGVIAKGAGLVGAGISAADAVNDYRHGKFGWAQGLELFGAGAEVLGTVLDFTPLAPLGVALQVGGAAASAVGSGMSAVDQATESSDAIDTSKEEKEKADTQLEGQKRSAVSGLTSAAQGGAAVARQVQ